MLRVRLRHLRAWIAASASPLAVYDLPFFKNDNWFMKNVVGNWQFSPIYTLQSPEYATCQSNVDSNLNGDSAPDRCIFNPAGVPDTSSTVTGAEELERSDGGLLGQQPDCAVHHRWRRSFRNSRAQHAGHAMDQQLGHSALKRVNITERQSIAFSVLAVNLFNHAQYVPGYPVVNDVQSYGQTAGPIRNTLIPGQATFANWPAAFSNHPRQLVLVLKYNF